MAELDAAPIPIPRVCWGRGCMLASHGPVVSCMQENHHGSYQSDQEIGLAPQGGGLLTCSAEEEAGNKEPG